MPEVKSLLSKLSKFYWSPERPEAYTILVNGKNAGIGIIAHTNYAAFNYAWACSVALNQPLDTEVGHHHAITNMVAAQSHTDSPLGNGMTVGCMLTLLPEAEFKVWLPTATVSAMTKKLFYKMYKPHELQNIQRLQSL